MLILTIKQASNQFNSQDAKNIKLKEEDVREEKDIEKRYPRKTITSKPKSLNMTLIFFMQILKILQFRNVHKRVIKIYIKRPSRKYDYFL